MTQPCVKRVEKVAAKVAGVEASAVNFATEIAVGDAGAGFSCW